MAEPNDPKVTPAHNPEPTPQPDPKPTPQPDTNPEPNPEPNPNPAHDPTPDPNPEPKPNPAPEPDPEPTAEPPKETGVPFYDNAAKVLHEAGMDVTAITDEINGDGLTDATKKSISEKLGEAQANLLFTGYENQRRAEEANVQVIYNEFGGEDNWKAVQEWSVDALTEQESIELSSKLKQGGDTAKEAVAVIKEKYLADPNVTISAENLMSGDGTAQPTPTVEPISRSEYMKEKSEAVNSNNAAKVKELEDRARFTMQNQPDIWRPVMGRF